MSHGARGSTAPAAEAPLLVLFDIDGTLLTGATEAHRDSLHDALLAVHGVDARGIAEPPSPAGRTDNEIARLILRAAGVPEADIDAGAEAVRAECCRRFAARGPGDLTGCVLPGVRQTLEALLAAGEHRLSLLTGNFEPVARGKLQAAGIGMFFAPGQGAFGSDHEDRRRLPEIARRRAAGADGLAGGWPRKATVVVGDTPRDIACARADGVACVGVATGQFTVEDLAAADAVCRGMEDVPAALTRLGRRG